MQRLRGKRFEMLASTLQCNLVSRVTPVEQRSGVFAGVPLMIEWPLAQRIRPPRYGRRLTGRGEHCSQPPTYTRTHTHTHTHSLTTLTGHNLAVTSVDWKDVGRGTLIATCSDDRVRITTLTPGCTNFVLMALQTVMIPHHYYDEFFWFHQTVCYCVQTVRLTDGGSYQLLRVLNTMDIYGWHTLTYLTFCPVKVVHDVNNIHMCPHIRPSLDSGLWGKA